MRVGARGALLLQLCLLPLLMATTARAQGIRGRSMRQQQQQGATTTTGEGVGGGEESGTVASAINVFNALVPLELLSAPCSTAMRDIQARLRASDTDATQSVAQAVFASGRVVEGLAVMNEALSGGSGSGGTSAGVDKDNALQSGLESLLIGYPWLSLGSPDSCAYIQRYHYCHVDLVDVFVRLGICVPSACGPRDVAVALNHTYRGLPLLAGSTEPNDWLNPALNVEGSTVCGDRRYAATEGTYVMASLTLLLMVLAACGTLIDVRRRHREDVSLKAHKRHDDVTQVAEGAERSASAMGRRRGSVGRIVRDALLCFSIPRNWNDLTAPSREGPFASLDGIRAMSITWVVWGHTVFFAMIYSSMSNMYHVMDVDGKGMAGAFAWQSIQGGVFAVDTFLFLSAFLGMHLMLKHLHKAPTTPARFFSGLPKLYVMRYLRLTPAYVYVLFMYWQVLRMATTGPFWGSTIGVDYEVCRQTWWTNLLYVNNLIHGELEGIPAICYQPSWYLAVDFQLFLVLPFVAYLAHKRPHTAVCVLITAVCINITAAWVMAYRHSWTVDLMDPSRYVSEYYLTPWFRASPYLLGMGLAILWQHQHTPTHIAHTHAHTDTHKKAAHTDHTQRDSLPHAHTHTSHTQHTTSVSEPACENGLTDTLTHTHTDAHTHTHTHTHTNGDVCVASAAQHSGSSPLPSTHTHTHTQTDTHTSARVCGVCVCVRTHSGVCVRTHIGAYLWVIAVGVFAALVYGGTGNFAARWSQDRMAAYIALGRPVWCVGLCIMCYTLCFLQHGGCIKRLLESWPLAVLSRLTYSIYLVHTAIIYWHLDSLRAGPHLDAAWAIINYLGTLFASILAAIFVYMVVELPVSRVLKLVLGGRGTDNRRPVDKKADEAHGIAANTAESRESVSSSSVVVVPTAPATVLLPAAPGTTLAQQSMESSSSASSGSSSSSGDGTDGVVSATYDATGGCVRCVDCGKAVRARGPVQ